MKVAKAFSLSPEERSRVGGRLRELLAEEAALLLAYLYGSFVAGRGFNDIDVAVWIDEAGFKDECELFEYQLALAVRLERELRPFPVDIICLNRASLPLRFRVVSEGVLLLCKDEQQRIEFESRTRVLFFDFLPHLEFYYEKLVLGR